MRDILVVVPARLGSTRVPRKALVDLAGLPLVERVRRAAIEADVGPVLVATDDPEIATVVRSFGGRVALTGDAVNGTSRVAAAARGISASAVLNVQGDQPLLDPEHVRALADLVADDAIATLAAPWADRADREDPAQVKVTFAGDLANDFHREPRAEPDARHLGLYGFTRAQLDRVTSLPVTDRARAEGLEQLSWLAAGQPIRVGLVERAAPAVDTMEHLAWVRRILGG